MTSAPHDLLVKKTFAIVENAEGELRAVLPNELSAAVDWSTLELVQGSFVDAHQREWRTDLLFSARIENHPTYFYFLFEHQSSVDPWMPLRMLSYMTRIWTWARENGAQSLPLIIPIILHHSASGWTASKTFGELLDIPEAIRKAARTYVPEFELLIDDLGRTTELELLRRSMPPIAKLVIWVLRAVRVNFDPALIDRWANEASRAGTAPAAPEALRALFGYLSEVEGGAQILEALLSAGTSKQVQEVAMGLRHEWEAEGEARGRAEGEARGRAEGEARGRAEGEARGRAEIVLKQLRLKFGSVSPDVVSRLRAASVEELERFAERVLTEDDIERVFA